MAKPSKFVATTQEAKGKVLVKLKRWKVEGGKSTNKVAVFKMISDKCMDNNLKTGLKKGESKISCVKNKVMT